MRARITHPEVNYDAHTYVEGDIIEDDSGAEKLIRWGYAVEVSEEGAVPEVPEVPEAFDPGAHSIVDVERYVEAHPATLDAVYVQESEGKNRAKLLASLDARRPENQEG